MPSCFHQSFFSLFGNLEISVLSPNTLCLVLNTSMQVLRREKEKKAF